MAETKLTHKLRNPKSYNNWINIWTSHFTNDNDVDIYNIYPSSNWKIPISQLTPNVVEETNGDQTVTENNTANLPYTFTVPIDQITDTNMTHNVTTPKDSSVTNALTKFDSNGDLVAGPTLSDSGTINSFLNAKGDWITINARDGITFDDPTNTHQIILRHTMSTTGQVIGSGQDSSGTEIYVPYFTYDNYGHITTASTFKHTINNLGNNNIADNAAISPSKIDNLTEYITDTVTNSNSTGMLNTQANNGIVAAGGTNTDSVWTTDNEGNPSWRKITADHMNLADNSIPSSKIDTQLLGVWITTSSHKELAGTFDDLDTDWDENHCGIWIEI